MILIRESSKPVWIPATFIRWMYNFEGKFFEFRKYYIMALETDASRWP